MLDGGYVQTRISGTLVSLDDTLPTLSLQNKFAIENRKAILPSETEVETRTFHTNRGTNRAENRVRWSS